MTSSLKNIGLAEFLSLCLKWLVMLADPECHEVFITSSGERIHETIKTIQEKYACYFRVLSEMHFQETGNVFSQELSLALETLAESGVLIRCGNALAIRWNKDTEEVIKDIFNSLFKSEEPRAITKFYNLIRDLRFLIVPSPINDRISPAFYL